jgi:MGT family glycosyltransferase
MARLLFTVWPFLTHLDPFVALARAARARGHEVAFYTGGEAGRLLAPEQFRCFPFQAVDWSRVAATVDNLIARRLSPFHVSRNWARFLVETVPAQAHDLEAVLVRWPADILVCDIAMWAPILILYERTGIPVVPFSHVANCILPGPEGPIQGIALPRDHNVIQKLAAEAVSRAVKLITARTRARANALRRGFGLSPLRVSVNEFTGTLPLYLMPSVPELDNHRRDLPPSVRYVGACLWQNGPRQAPAWIADIPNDRPCVLVDEGGFFAPEPRLLWMAARGLADLPLSVVLLAGHGRDLAQLKVGPLAPNVALHSHAPVSGLLPLARAFVTNGNSNSVAAALQAGVPIVVLPSTWDQAELAWRVQETGAGLRLAPWRATPGDLRQAVERVLDEPSFREAAAKTGTAMARAGGPTRATELLEDVVAASHHAVGSARL